MKKIFFVIMVCCIALMSSCEKDEVPDYRSKWVGVYYAVEKHGGESEVIYMEKATKPLLVTMEGDSMIHLGGYVWASGKDTMFCSEAIDTSMYVGVEGEVLNDDGYGWVGVDFNAESFVTFIYRGPNLCLGNPGTEIYKRYYVRSDYPNLTVYQIYGDRKAI